MRNAPKKFPANTQTMPENRRHRRTKTAPNASLPFGQSNHGAVNASV
jgi:hypothetical protein